MDELFETLTLVQTRTVTQFPIVMFGKEYYKELWNYLEYMATQETISRDDLKFLLLTDSVAEAMDHIHTYINTHYKVKPRKRQWWLFEKR